MMPRRVGYVVSRFPKTTETFIVREMRAVQHEGWDVVPFAIRRETGEIVQPGAQPFVDRLVAISDLGWRRHVRAQARLFRRSARDWRALWWSTIAGNARSPRFLLRGVVVAFGAPAIAEEVVQRELVHLHAHWATHSGLLAHLVAKLTGIPYSITLHAHDLHVDRTMLGTKLRSATAVVTISEHNAELLRTEYPEIADRVSVVHCGVDAREIPFTLPNGVRQPLRLACVAGLRPFKGHRYLLDAVAELERRGLAVRCDLVGDGPLRAELEQRSGDNVVFHGATSVERALALVVDADLFVMPSVELDDGRRDGIPVALMEAMALGVPVIASDVSGIPELVRDGSTGILVPQGEAIAIADAVERLAGDVHLRRTIATKARRTIEARFDVTQSARSMTALFDHTGDSTAVSDLSDTPAPLAGSAARSNA